ncbi:MAG: OmpA family protein [Halioglobus sp.]
MAALLIPFITVFLLAVFDNDAPPPPPPPPPPDKIVLLPDEDGNVGKLIVTSAAGEQTLDSAYAAVEVQKSGEISETKESKEAVASRYGTLLDATPPEPKSFTVNFMPASSEVLTEESVQIVAKMQAFLAERPAPEITVIGHTDRVGSDEDNDQLSNARAQTVRRLIEEAGVSAVNIDAAGRGEREPLVQTADKVSEPRNRRVEINIR